MNSREYKISSTSVVYPYKAYPSQISMIDRVIKSLQRNQNCLIESPTGSGKSLALLCAVLAWREEEYKKVEKDVMQFYGAGDAVQPITQSVVSAAASSSSTQPAQSARTSSANNNDNSIIDLTGNDIFSGYGDGDCFVGLDTTPEKFDVAPRFREPSALPPIGDDGTAMSLTEDELRDKVWEARKRIPKIYFGTRTHKQLAQLISELKKTHYANVRMTILASRDQTCINEYVRSQSNRGEACRQLLNPDTNYLTGTCKYHSKWKRQFQKPYLLRGAIRRNQDSGSMLPSSVWDIEDLVDVGKQHGFCPYYASSTTLMTDAELIFCPYNYLIDPVVRKAVGIDLKEQIIVLDEAHNIEDVCRDAASFVFDSNEFHDAGDHFRLAADTESSGPVQDANYLGKVCTKIVKWLEEQTKGPMTIVSHSLRCREWEGNEFLGVLAKLELSQDAAMQIQQAVNAVSNQEEGDNGDKTRQRGPDGEPTARSIVPSLALKTMEKVALFLEYFYKADLLDYKMCLKEERLTEVNPLRPKCQNAITLNVWCMNPAVSFRDVGSVARSVILASGTLAPMKTFEVELGADFKLQLEATHVLSKDRMFVASIAKGPSGRPLRVTYQNTSEHAFQDELGQLVIDIASTVPHGVLCFFPSYKVLDLLHERWKSTGAMKRLSKLKRIILEPRRSEQLNSTMERFYAAVKTPAKFGSSCTGAIFLAVCRGKVSEGLDFADDNARAVITVGIPYPNVSGLEVTHKRNYNDERVKRGNTTLSGDQWYEIQAFRALNQALGRCLRHRNDWGALILIDERFGSYDSQRYCGSLSRWIRENIRHYGDFKTARSDLESFTQRLMENKPNEVGGGDAASTVSSGTDDRPRRKFSPHLTKARLFSDAEDDGNASTSFVAMTPSPSSSSSYISSPNNPNGGGYIFRSSGGTPAAPASASVSSSGPVISPYFANTNIRRRDKNSRLRL